MNEPLTEMTQVPDPTTLPVDPSQGQRQQEAGNSTLDTVFDGLEVGGLVIDAATLAVQAGGLALEAGTATVKIAAAGIEVVGSIFGALDGL